MTLPEIIRGLTEAGNLFSRYKKQFKALIGLIREEYGEDREKRFNILEFKSFIVDVFISNSNLDTSIG